MFSVEVKRSEMTSLDTILPSRFLKTLLMILCLPALLTLSNFQGLKLHNFNPFIVALTVLPDASKFVIYVMKASVSVLIAPINLAF